MPDTSLHPHQSFQSGHCADSSPRLDDRLNKVAKKPFQADPLWWRLFEECRWRSKTLWQIGRIALVHMRGLLGGTPFFVDYGLSYERDAVGRRVRRVRTQARIDGTENL